MGPAQLHEAVTNSFPDGMSGRLGRGRLGRFHQGLVTNMIQYVINCNNVDAGLVVFLPSNQPSAWLS